MSKKIKIKQTALAASIQVQNGSGHGGGSAMLQFPTVIEVDESEFIYTLPMKSGTIAIETEISGSFTTVDGKTITITNGIVTSIV